MELFNDPETLWLNLTNLGLGAITIVCLAVVGRAVFLDILVRARNRALAKADDHAMMVPGLGLTMADGGEPIAKEGQNDVPKGLRSFRRAGQPDEDPPNIVRSEN
jgi:hypothetical protein